MRYAMEVFMIPKIFDRIRRIFRHIARLNRRWKLLTIRKILFLPHILSPSEQRLLLFLGAVWALAGAGLAGRAYVGLTHPIPAIGGSYTEGVIGSPRAVNPLYGARDSDRDLERLIFSGLLAYDGTGNIRPDLAQRHEISQDGKIYTVVLRENALWHDGARVDADDVVFTIKRIQNAQYKSPFRANWQGVDAEKIDERTVRFTLRTPYAPFIENLTQGIIPRHLWENVEPASAPLHELNLRPVGSGPYAFKQMKTQSDGSVLWYTVRRNQNYYYNEGPYLKEITLMFYATEDDMLTAWRRGDIEGFGPISQAHARALDRDRATILSLTIPRIFSVFLNPREALPLADKKVRDAIARAIDKETVVRAASGGAIVADTILPISGASAPASPEQFAPFSPEQSKKILDGAGWKDANQDGVREKKIVVNRKTATQTLRFTLATGDSPELERAAELIKTMLADIGVAVEIRKRSFADLEQTIIRPRAFDMLLFGQVYGYEPDPFSFWHSSQIKDPGLNVALFSNKQADRALESARRETRRAARTALYREFSAIAAQEIPAVPLYTQRYLYLIPPDIRGIDITKISLPSDRFNDISYWYRKTKRVW